MKRVLAIPGERLIDLELESSAIPVPEWLTQVGVRADLRTVIEVSRTRGDSHPPIEIDISADQLAESGAPAVSHVIQVEFQRGGLLWLTPESVFEMFGERLTRDAAPQADQIVWKINPIVDGGDDARGLPDSIVKIGQWVVTLAKGVGTGVVAGKPIHNLAKAIEDHQHGSRKPGMYSLSLKGPLALERCDILKPEDGKPLLLFLHGTLSSTTGSFSRLWEPNNVEGAALRRALIPFYGEKAYALEHYTLHESPIQNALMAIGALPDNARVHLVSHSRGGLIGELLCLSGVVSKSEFSPATLARLLRQKALLSSATIAENEIDELLGDPSQVAALIHRMEASAAKAPDPVAERILAHWVREASDLEALVDALYKKNIRIERFVRVACPSVGTTLAMRRIDVWLSVFGQLVDKAVEGIALKYFPPAIPLRALIGMIAQPDAADRLPGLWSMRPQSPLVALLNFQALEVDADLTVIAGNNEGKGFLSGGLEKLMNRLFKSDNDYVVNTGAMFGGLPRREGQTRYQLDRGGEVTHFRYFQNADSVRWLEAGLTRADGDMAGFCEMNLAPRISPAQRALTKPRRQGSRPVVFLLPGIMGSELSVNNETIWLHYNRLMRGRIAEIAIERGGVAAPRFLDGDYSELIDYLRESYEVIEFPYDWRQSVAVQADRLAQAMRAKLDELDKLPTPLPVRLLAHSMGGLVARSMIARHAEVWQRVCANPDARLVMLGTPNGGSFEILRLLLAQSATLHKLSLLDFRHSTRGLLSIISAFPGVLELLPRENDAYFAPETWNRLHGLDEVRRNGWIIPRAKDLASARAALGGFDGLDIRRMVYVAGCAESTPSGWVEDVEWDYRSGKKRKSIAFTSSPRGDGKVLWDTGIPSGCPTWYMPGVAHGDLCNAPAYFDALVDLIESGRTDKLPIREPTTRSTTRAAMELIRCDLDVEYPSARAAIRRDDLLDDFLGRAKRRPTRRPLPSKTKVSVVHGNLAYARFPVMIGHYAGDTLVGAEAALNTHLKGELHRRIQLGLYAGARDTATVVLQPDPNARPAGAIVIGLGRPDELGPGSLRAGVTRAALEYALLRLQQPEDAHTDSPVAVNASISCLLVGTGAGAMTVRNALTAILSGIGAANRRLAELSLESKVWLNEVEFVELWLDQASQAAEALDLALKEGELAELFQLASGEGEPPAAGAMVHSGQGGLRRIDFDEAPNWWQRLEITYDQQLCQLRYVAMGASARADEMLVAGQSDLAENFIAEAIGNTTRNPEVSRTLFEMLVPNRLKEMAPDQQDVWLLVDQRTGQFPWELMEDRWSRDGKPVAVAAGMLRQLKDFPSRERPAMAISDAALVIGNPVLPRRQDFDFQELPGAQREAEAVAVFLESRRFEVTRQINTSASSILTKLHAKDYRILHLAGHGVHEWTGLTSTKPTHGDGSQAQSCKHPISGMLIGDHVFLTPGDVAQMRFVPELVFINCCHLGQLSESARSESWRLGNRLAVNLAAEFIRMGVRAVVAAGWAVDDAAACTFATAFYDCLVSGGAFGQAVKFAREQTYNGHGNTNTWGAFQCYGDPNWQLRESHRQERTVSLSKMRSARHAIVELENLRARLQKADSDAVLLLDEVTNRLEKEHATWLRNAEVAVALALALGEEERFEDAIKHLNTAVASDNALVSLKAIEQRANFAVKQALKEVHAGEPAPAIIESALTRMENARTDLEGLLRFGETGERFNLLGSAWKRTSWIAPDAARRESALIESFNSYMRAYDVARGKSPSAALYPMTNLLGMYAVLGWFDLQSKVKNPGDTGALIDEALRVALERERRSPEVWNTVAPGDLTVVKLLFDAGEEMALAEQARAHYQRAIDRGLTLKELGSIREHNDYLLYMASIPRRVAQSKSKPKTSATGKQKADTSVQGRPLQALNLIQKFLQEQLR